MMGIMEQQESVGPVNLGNPTEFTIRQLAAVLQKVETPSKIVEKSLPADDPTQRKPDIALAQKLIFLGTEGGIDRRFGSYDSLLP